MDELRMISTIRDSPLQRRRWRRLTIPARREVLERIGGDEGRIDKELRAAIRGLGRAKVSESCEVSKLRS